MYTKSELPTVQFPQPRVAIVVDTIQPRTKGWVKFEGTQWSARFYQPDCQKMMMPGERVQVLARQGNTLLVMAENQVVSDPVVQNDRSGWIGKAFGELCLS